MANGGQVDIFGAYVRTRLDGWGREFALHRDCEYLGHQSENMLYQYFRHDGQIPAKPVGYKPLNIDADALKVEQIVTGIARENKAAACALRGYYCGTGRRKIERLETANELLRLAGGKKMSASHYMELIKVGFDMVSARISDE